MEVALRDFRFIDLISFVIGIRVQGLVGHDMVPQQRFEVLLSIAAEQEAVDSGTKLLESKVGRCEQGATDVVGCIIQDW